MKRSAEAVSTKHINTQIKSVDGSPEDPEGTFTGYASVFGNIDSYGEMVVKGAFAQSLEDQAAYPVYWSHQMSNPMMNIGKTLEIREDDHGLFVKAQLDLDTEMGAQVHRLIKDGRVGQMSFAFDVEDYAVADSEELGPHIELRRLKLHEVSVVQVGANQETELLDVKDRVTRAKAGRSISKSNADKLDEAVRLITDVIGDSAKNDSDDESEDTEDDAKAASPEAKSIHPDAALAALYIHITEGD